MQFVERGSLRFMSAKPANLLDAAGIIRSENFRFYNIRTPNSNDVAYNLRTGMSCSRDKNGSEHSGHMRRSIGKARRIGDGRFDINKWFL